MFESNTAPNISVNGRGMDVRKMREDLHVSQAQFSEIVGIPQYRLSGIELKKDIPSEGEIVKIAVVAEKIVRGEIKLRKKKRISKEIFHSSIVAMNPRRGYESILSVTFKMRCKDKKILLIIQIFCMFFLF